MKLINCLREDGYELTVESKISGRNVYNWQVYRRESVLYVPFSLRNKELISAKKITLSLPNEVRYQIFKIMNEFDKVFYLSDVTDWNYTKKFKRICSRGY